MKRIIQRLAISASAAILPTGAALAFSTADDLREVCFSEGKSELNQKVWDYVVAQDKTEIYIAYLEACGSSPVVADYAAKARAVVIERTANYTNMPTGRFTILYVEESANVFRAVYIG